MIIRILAGINLMVSTTLFVGTLILAGQDKLIAVDSASASLALLVLVLGSVLVDMCLAGLAFYFSLKLTNQTSTQTTKPIEDKSLGNIF